MRKLALVLCRDEERLRPVQSFFQLFQLVVSFENHHVFDFLVEQVVAALSMLALVNSEHAESLTSLVRDVFL